MPTKANSNNFFASRSAEGLSVNRHRAASFGLRFLVLLAAMSILTKTRGLGLGGRIFVNGFSSNHYSYRTPLSRIATTTRSMALSASATKIDTTSTTSTTDTKERLFSEEINVLYDSKCGVCKLEMEWLVSRDIKLNGANNRKLKLTDLEDDFDETDPSNGGIDYATGMAAIYAIKHDGTISKGVPVFEVAYDQVGLGMIWKINQVPAINRFLEWGYEIFARNRTRITRGASLEALLELNEAKKKQAKLAAEEGCETCSDKAS